MRTNLLYNKIVADTASKGFIESFNEIALPKLEARFPDVDEVVIYEDYLSDGLFANGSFFCPLTLVKEGRLSRAYASWRCDAKRFENSIPYAYVGKELLNIEISDSAPDAIESKISGRMPHFAENSIKLSVAANAPTKTFLSGKYSQSFVDVMRDSLTRELEREFHVKGIKDSSLSITLMFAPESFMEHVRDNVSYRRVLLSANACAPRDLWIKWTRLDGKGTYTVSNHVTAEQILFELCDEVPEKIREREYRYLVKSEGQSQFKSAMSRKNFTEWRELMKRVIKRGELDELHAVPELKLTSPETLTAVVKESVTEPLVLPANEEAPVNTVDKDDVFDGEISLKLKSVLEGYNIDSGMDDEYSEEEEINPDITELLRALISGDGEENGLTGEEISEQVDGNDELPPFDLDEDAGEEEMEALSIISEIETEENEEPDEALTEIEVAEDDKEAEPEEESEAYSYGEIDASETDEFNDELVEKEYEIASLKEENEELSKKLLESEAERDRLLKLVSGYEIKLDEAKRERMMLIENLDAAKRREERERERLAEAAKLAIASRSGEDAVASAEELNEEPIEEKKQEPETLAEKIEETPTLRESNKTKAEAPIEKAAPVRYVTKVADISFRHPVDPNITKRIQDIIVTTVKYMGKENVYMKIKASIPDNYMVRLEFVKIPENESELLSDIIRVLGHSRLGIVKVLLD